jgi:hypothetical protein
MFLTKMGTVLEKQNLENSIDLIFYISLEHRRNNWVKMTRKV